MSSGGILEVRIIQGSDLKPSASLFGKNEYYTQAWVDPSQKARTGVVETDNVNPFWDQKLDVRMRGDGGEVLTVKICSPAAAWTGGPKTIGTLRIPLDSIASEAASGSTLQFQVIRPSGRAKGSLTLIVKLPSTKPAPSPAPVPAHISAPAPPALNPGNLFPPHPPLPNPASLYPHSPSSLSSPPTQDYYPPPPNPAKLFHNPHPYPPPFSSPPPPEPINLFHPDPYYSQPSHYPNAYPPIHPCDSDSDSSYPPPYPPPSTTANPPNNLYEQYPYPPTQYPPPPHYPPHPTTYPPPPSQYSPYPPPPVDVYPYPGSYHQY